MFATAVTGVGGLLAEELSAVAGVTVRDQGNDGRADIVVFDAAPQAERAVLRLRLAEDVFVEAGRARRDDGDRPHWIAGRVWRTRRAAEALAVYGRLTRPAGARATFRVIVRVLQERSFLRTALRREVAGAVARDQQRWRFGDPARVEVWVCEYERGQFVAGLRVSGAAMRQHNGRAAERPGALRPTVAAAMVRLAGAKRGNLLDPCCGSGTVLAEAVTAGWQTYGGDLDPDAVDVARHNSPRSTVERGDARHLPYDDAAMAAAVSNLPFGQQYDVDDEMGDWLGDTLAELARVVRPGGHVVLLAPKIPRAAAPRALTLKRRIPIRLLGTKATIWVYDRGEHNPQPS